MAAHALYNVSFAATACASFAALGLVEVLFGLLPLALAPVALVAIDVLDRITTAEASAVTRCLVPRHVRLLVASVEASPAATASAGTELLRRIWGDPRAAKRLHGSPLYVVLK